MSENMEKVEQSTPKTEPSAAEQKIEDPVGKEESPVKAQPEAKEEPEAKAPDRGPTTDMMPRKQPPPEPKEPEKKPFNKRWLALFAIPVIAAAGAGGYYYWQTANQYKTQFYPNTFVGEMNVGGKTVEQVRTEINKEAEKYSLTFTQRGEEIVYSAADLGVHYVLEDANGGDLIQGMMDGQEPMKWLVKKNETYRYDYPELVYDKACVEQKIGELDFVDPANQKPAVDAYISYDEKAHSYQIVPEEMGNYVDRSVVSDALCGALDQWSDKVEIPDTAFEQPAVTSDDPGLNAFVAEVEKYLSAEITYEDGDVQVVVDRPVIEEFLDVDPEAQTVVIVESRIQSYINKTLDGAFDTLGKERTITTSLSGTFTIGGGTYGKVVYTLEELPKLVESIKAGEKVTRAPAYRQTEVSNENSGIGDTFVDVNLSQQTLLYVKDGEDFMTSEFVSGCVNKKRGTPTGIYKLELKAREYTMKKYNAFVHYWMNFYSAVGVGFHDASWRGRFGGNIYKSNGSHGCINMPYESAKKLYNNLDYGTPVLVHY